MDAVDGIKIYKQLLERKTDTGSPNTNRIPLKREKMTFVSSRVIWFEERPQKASCPRKPVFPQFEERERDEVQSSGVKNHHAFFF